MEGKSIDWYMHGHADGASGNIERDMLGRARRRTLAKLASASVRTRRWATATRQALPPGALLPHLLRSESGIGVGVRCAVSTARLGRTHSQTRKLCVGRSYELCRVVDIGSNRYTPTCNVEEYISRCVAVCGASGVGGVRDPSDDRSHMRISQE